MTGDSPLLECVGVSKSYGGVHAVSDVSFQLWPGQILGLVGPNGAGKTTLVDLIDGEQSPDGGQVLVASQPLVGPPARRARRGLARTFQHPQVALDLTVRENILVGLAARQLDSPWRTMGTLLRGMLAYRTPDADGVIQQTAASLGIGAIERPCSELTLGQLRLVEVARALVQQPSLILLDEPFAGADADGVAGVTAAFREVLRRGCGVLLVDHNVDIVASLVSHIVLMNLGQVIFDGEPEQCLASEEMRSVYFGGGSQR